MTETPSLRGLVAAALDMTEDALSPAMSIELDLALDSLSMTSLIMQIERAFDIEIDARLADDLQTLGDLEDAVLRLSGRALPEGGKLAAE